MSTKNKTSLTTSYVPSLKFNKVQSEQYPIRERMVNSINKKSSQQTGTQKFRKLEINIIDESFEYPEKKEEEF